MRPLSGWLETGLPLLVALTSAGCGAVQRLDSPCRAMLSPVVYEMRRDSPGLAVLDVRPEEDRTEPSRRIPGSREIPLSELTTHLDSLEAFRETTVIVFGRDGQEGCIACELLASEGFRYVIYVQDGAEGWFRTGHPGRGAAPKAVPTREAGS